MAPVTVFIVSSETECEIGVLADTSRHRLESAKAEPAHFHSPPDGRTVRVARRLGYRDYVESLS